MFIFTETQRRHWTTHGWILLSHSLEPEVILALSGWVEEMAKKGRKSRSAAALLRAYRTRKIPLPSGAFSGRSRPTSIASGRRHAADDCLDPAGRARLDLQRKD